MKKIIYLAAFSLLAVLFCSANLPKGWFVAGSQNQNYEMGIAKGEGEDGGNAATIKSTAMTKEGFGTLMQQAKPGAFLGKRIRMTGKMKSEKVEESAGFWLRIDRACSQVSFDNMNSRAVKGDTDWKSYQIVLDVPADATNMAYGALLSGTGQIWFDQIAFEVVDNDVEVTSEINTAASEWNYLDKPENLGFEE